jgi:hypothetical protein
MGNKKDQTVLGQELCQCLPFVHAFTGCGITSRIFGIGKQVAVREVATSALFRETSKLFLNADVGKTEIIHALIELYGGMQDEILDLLRFRRYTQKVMTSNSQVLVHTLPPTSDAAGLHSLRTYFQCQIWVNMSNLDPSEWGWQLLSN